MMISCSEEEFSAHQEESDGICLGCGEWSFGGCEPDARNYKCEVCGERKVVGAEEALLMGKLDITD
jgi:hypothetical protein